MSRGVALLTAVTILMGSGIVHGIWAERWSPSQQLRAAVERVERVPLQVGEWIGKAVDEDAASFVQAGAQAYWTRAYTHPRKKGTLYAILMCGRSGKMAVHTPEVCYRGAGFELANRPETWTVRTSAGESLGTLWTASFSKESGTDLRLAWGWNDGTSWKASANPRWEFGGEPFLYKLYLSYEAAPASERAAQDFARQFLPQLDQTLARRD